MSDIMGHMEIQSDGSLCRRLVLVSAIQSRPAYPRKNNRALLYPQKAKSIQPSYVAPVLAPFPCLTTPAEAWAQSDSSLFLFY